MKNLQGSKIVALLVALFVGTMTFVSCSNDNMGNIAGPADPANTINTLTKRNNDTPMVYPQSGSTTIKFSSKKNQYNGGNICLLPSRSVFDLDGGSLTPPPSIPWGDPVTITFEVDKDTVTNELIFTFGPHGSQFSPAARIILDWSDLGIEVPTLYYIDENGNYIEQIPEHIDVRGQKMTIYVDHFSRYALVHA